MKRSAVLSPDGTYRYSLTREWGDLGHTMTFVMLNPSTADADIDDPTIRRCVGFAKREGCDALRVVNLMAWRATDPGAVPVAPACVGPDNRQHWGVAITEAALGRGVTVAAWGTGSGLRNRAWFFALADEFRATCATAGIPLACLGVTKEGHPRHPLYVPADAPLVSFGVAP